MEVDGRPQEVVGHLVWHGGVVVLTSMTAVAAAYAYRWLDVRRAELPSALSEGRAPHERRVI